MPGRGGRSEPARRLLAARPDPLRREPDVRNPDPASRFNDWARTAQGMIVVGAGCALALILVVVVGISAAGGSGVSAVVTSCGLDPNINTPMVTIKVTNSRPAGRGIDELVPAIQTLAAAHQTSHAAVVRRQLMRARSVDRRGLRGSLRHREHPRWPACSGRRSLSRTSCMPTKLTKFKGCRSRQHRSSIDPRARLVRLA